MAESVLSAVPQAPVPLIGFGGTHYATRETEIALTSRGAFGHIAHTREVAGLDEAMVRAMQEKSGAVAAYIDRKAPDRDTLTRITGISTPCGSHASPRARSTRSATCHGRCIPGSGRWQKLYHGFTLFHPCPGGCRHQVLVKANPVLIAETVKWDEPGLIKMLDSLPLVHLSTHDNRFVPEFITYTGHSPEIIHDLNTLCVKIIRNKEITERREMT